MKKVINKGLLNVAVVVIVILVVLNVVITLRNIRIIDANRQLQKQAEEVKVTVSQFAITIIHNLDLGLRSYALFEDEKYLYPLRVAVRDKDSIYHVVETLLAHQQYPLEEFKQLRDSIDAYAALCLKLKQLFDQGQRKEFLRLGDQDKGYHLWLQYEKFAAKVYAFEDQINEAATARYRNAIRNNRYVQILFVLICLPTLFFTALQTHRKSSMAEKLRRLEAERAAMLFSQNEKLEQMVYERTQEIHARNLELSDRNTEIASQNEELVLQQEEISSQRDMLEAQNRTLSDAREIIQKQNDEIQRKNDFLEEEVQRRTKDLVEYNQQLEQFAFIAAHNLRAPVARILGLGKVLSFDEDRPVEEEKMIVGKLIKTTVELDKVIKDLTLILEIKSNTSHFLTRVSLCDEMKIVRSHLAKEIAETHTVIHESFRVAPVVTTVKAYADSILLNLINNAIKYRHPDRHPVIQVRSYRVNDAICLSVKDNGLGIAERYHEKLFSLYTRFHFHVEGKGLGLYVVKTQVEAMGGLIEVESEENVGTTFRVYFRGRHAEYNGHPSGEISLEGDALQRS